MNATAAVCRRSTTAILVRHDRLTDCQLPQASRAGFEHRLLLLVLNNLWPLLRTHFSRWLAIQNRVIMQGLNDIQCHGAITIKDKVDKCAESPLDSSDE